SPGSPHRHRAAISVVSANPWPHSLALDAAGLMHTEARPPGNAWCAPAVTIAGLAGIAILIGAAYVAPSLPFLLALGLGMTAIAALHPPSALAAIPASIG